MEQHRQLALKALEQLKGDNLYRAKSAFRNCTPEQMQEQYGESGKTRAEIVADYEAYETKVDEAMIWVKEVKNG